MRSFVTKYCKTCLNKQLLKLVWYKLIFNIHYYNTKSKVNFCLIWKCILITSSPKFRITIYGRITFNSWCISGGKHQHFITWTHSPWANLACHTEPRPHTLENVSNTQTEWPLNWTCWCNELVWGERTKPFDAICTHFSIFKYKVCFKMSFLILIKLCKGYSLFNLNFYIIWMFNKNKYCLILWTFTIFHEWSCGVGTEFAYLLLVVYFYKFVCF